MVVNPLETDAAVKADLHLRPLPGSDGALALAMANVILSEGLYDPEFVTRCTTGFVEYGQTVKDMPPERAQEITGIPTEMIREGARLYASSSPAAILLGYGLQRYANGGQTIRFIDALAALTGNIGISGGGANYCHQTWSPLLNDITGKELAGNGRQLDLPVLADELRDSEDQSVKVMIITRANPITQHPGSQNMLKAFAALDFRVVVDMFMTDTARMADLFLPSAYFLEEENLIYSSWNHYISYNPRMVPPLGESKPEADIFSELARTMGLPGFPDFTAREWIQWILEPAASVGITLERLMEGPMLHPRAGEVPWQNRGFATDDGRFHFAGGEWQDVRESPCEEYPYRLMTPHHRDYMHSQFYPRGEEGRPEAFVSRTQATEAGMAEGQKAVVETRYGRLDVVVKCDDMVPAGMVLIFEGGWLEASAR
jgi:anaerobic selenocysteine-containing dehydrogenase